MANVSFFSITVQIFLKLSVYCLRYEERKMIQNNSKRHQCVFFNTKIIQATHKLSSCLWINNVCTEFPSVKDARFLSSRFNAAVLSQRRVISQFKQRRCLWCRPPASDSAGDQKPGFPPKSRASVDLTREAEEDRLTSGLSSQPARIFCFRRLQSDSAN